MRSLTGRLWFRVLAGIVLLLVVLAWGLQYWLKSGVGRGMVETRLSAALGRPVRLAGDFSVGLLPLPGAGGTDLVIYTTDARWTVASAGRYRVSLALKPLLRGEVEIVAVRIGDARMDFGRLANEPGSAESAPAPFSNIPDIREFELESTSLYLAGPTASSWIRIDRLSVETFAVNSRAPFELDLALVAGESETVQLEGEGTLTLQAAGIAELGFSALGIELDAWAVRNARGKVVADLMQTRADVSLESRGGSLPFQLALSANWSPRFITEEEGVAIESLVFELAEERIAGAGCFLNGTPPELHIMLESEALNLANLAILAEDLRKPPSPGSPGPDGTEVLQSPAAGLELPFELSLAADVAHADYEDVIAQGVRLAVGGPPDCPGVL